ncbi:MAG: beta-propeller domain-containing protein [Firmicutes bacterium]|nr:beta-propeller domain-containing protein [Bacillota bacterium]
MKKRRLFLSVALAAVLLIGVAFGSACTIGANGKIDDPDKGKGNGDNVFDVSLPAGIEKLSARDAIIAEIEKNAGSGDSGGYLSGGDSIRSDSDALDLSGAAPAPSPPMAPGDALQNESSEVAEGDYAKTNVQTEGVDEGDILKVDENYIYKLSNAGLVIVDIRTMAIASKVDYENFVPVEMYVLGNKLIVIGGVYQTYHYYGGRGMTDMICYSWASYEKTRVAVYDISSRSSIKEVNKYEFSGYFLTSRLIGDKLVLALNYTFYVYPANYFADTAAGRLQYAAHRDTYLPRINGEEIAPENIYMYKTSDTYWYYRNFVIIASVDVSTAAMQYSAHLGLYGWETMYVSKDNLYIFNSDWSGVRYETEPYTYGGYYTVYDNKGNPVRDLFGRYITEYREYTYDRYIKQLNPPQSKIFRISLDTLKCTGRGVIDGFVADRYYADEFEENLRVVSYASLYNYQPWENKSYTVVSVLDKALKVIGKIENIAAGETIYSVRFHKLQASIVTFLQVDPLFTVDLSDPKNPKISREHKEEGVSDYLQYLSDDVILGLGRNTYQNQWGGTSFGSMKVQLYSSDPEKDAFVCKVDVGAADDYVWSEAIYNPKAILNDTARSMFSFPVEIRSNSYYSLKVQGLAVFKYDLDAVNPEDMLVFLGILSDLPENVTYTNWYDYYDYYHSYVARGARIGDKIYTVSDKYVTSYSLSDLKLDRKVQIAEFPSSRVLFGW